MNFKKIISFLLCLDVAIGCIFFGFERPAKVFASTYDSRVIEVAKLVNNERSKRGLSPLKVIPELMDDAKLRSKEITENYSHTRPDGTSCSTAINSNVKRASNTWGENIAYADFSTPEQVMNLWMNSPGHKANILSSSFTNIGVGLTVKGKRYYWTQIFVGTYVSYPGEFLPQESPSNPSSSEKDEDSISTDMRVRYAKGYADTTNDGIVDAKDATLILIDYANTIVGYPSMFGGGLGDLNEDGKVTSEDATCLLIIYAESLVQ